MAYGVVLRPGDDDYDAQRLPWQRKFDPWPALIVGGGVGVGLAALLVDAFRWTIYALPVPGTTERMGAELFGSWVLPFEVLSILLLSALVGAIVLSRPDIGAPRAKTPTAGTPGAETPRVETPRGHEPVGEA